MSFLEVLVLFGFYDARMEAATHKSMIYNILLLFVEILLYERLF